MPRIPTGKIIDTSFFLEGLDALEETAKGLRKRYNDKDFVDRSDEIKNLKEKIGFKE
jgi:hypothetical protein